MLYILWIHPCWVLLGRVFSSFHPSHVSLSYAHLTPHFVTRLKQMWIFGEQPCWKMGTLTENQCWGAGDVKMFLLLKLLRALVLCCLMFSQFFHFLQVITMNAVFFQLSHTLLNMPASFNNLDNHSFFFMYPYIRQSVLHCLFNLTLVTMASFSSWCGQFVICL